MAKQKPSISDLVSEGIIKVGQMFFTAYDDYSYSGKVVDNEHIRIQSTHESYDPKNMGNHLYESFNKPASQICGGTVNAWLWWKYFKGNEHRPIDDWRREWLDKH